MPGRGRPRRGLKRKATEAAREQRLPEPDLRSNEDEDNDGTGDAPDTVRQMSTVIDFEEILRASRILPQVTPEVPALPAAPYNDIGSSVVQQVARPITIGPGARASSQFVNDGSLNFETGGRFAQIPTTRCVSDDIYIHIPMPLRAQIGRGEYVNLALLLKGGVELNDLCSGNNFRLTTDGTIEAKPRDCKDRIGSVEKWTDAFIIYMAIYLSTHPDKSVELLHYVHNIRDCANRQDGYGWRSYDEQFRMRQAAAPVSWATVNTELWWRCTQVRDAYTTSLAVATTSKPVGRLFTCNDYNSGTCTWPACRFAHVCSDCGLGHRSVHCGTRVAGETSVTSRGGLGHNFRGRTGFAGMPYRGQAAGRGSRAPWGGSRSMRFGGPVRRTY